jgi:hypothetical protein
MGPVPILNAASLIHARRPPYGGLLDDIYNEHPYALDMYVLFYVLIAWARVDIIVTLSKGR